MNIINVVDTILPVLAIAAQISIGVIIYSLIAKNKKIENILRSKALLFSFAVALASTLGSLFYSEIAGYDPCELCWFQRILMYPQVILLGTALYWKKGLEIISKNIIIFSSIGVLLAGYHYFLQTGVTNSASCGVVGYSVLCLQKLVMSFGYMTIPMMSLSSFLLIGLLHVLLLRGNK